mmetsp:Transcript_124352/g.359591  ORF Transcript_124352/g.359591 Transcript_124352/m.359591 type:complete len:232 (+) Transcript_124352:737-1432(+)
MRFDGGFHSLHLSFGVGKIVYQSVELVVIHFLDFGMIHKVQIGAEILSGLEDQRPRVRLRAFLVLLGGLFAAIFIITIVSKGVLTTELIGNHFLQAGIQDWLWHDCLETLVNLRDIHWLEFIIQVIKNELLGMWLADDDASSDASHALCRFQPLFVNFKRLLLSGCLCRPDALRLNQIIRRWSHKVRITIGRRSSSTGGGFSFGRQGLWEGRHARILESAALGGHDANVFG